MLTTLAAFIVAIGLLIAVHEWGHYRAARWCGVKVLRFSIGIGPRLFGWTAARSQTEFVIGLLPIGGYVKMLDEREGPVAEHERALAFNTQPLRSRCAIVAAGPLANLLLAVVLYCCVNWIGDEQAQAILSHPPQGSVAAVAGFKGGEHILRAGFEDESLAEVRSFEGLRWWVTRAALERHNLWLEYATTPNSSTARLAQLQLSTLDVSNADAQLFRSIGITAPFSQALIGDILPGGAAQEAQLRSGDVVLRVDATDIVDAGQLRELIRASGTQGTVQQQSWKIQRGDALLTLVVTPKPEKEGSATIGRVGAMIGAPPPVVRVRYGLVEGLVLAVERTGQMSLLTLRMLGQMVSGTLSYKNLSGPITIADYAGKSATMGINPFLLFLALMSISLGVLNLLPVPVLDGGHLMYYLWEFLTGKPVAPPWSEWLQKLGLAVLLLLMSVAIFNDVTRLLG